MKRLASIDIGSQTIRLLIGETDLSGRILPLFRDHSITRLGEGVYNTKYLQKGAMERASACINSFVRKARDVSVSKIFSVATSCVREANNGKQFLKKIHNETGILPRLLSGEEEAALSLRGVLSVFPSIDIPSLVIDIGGGSTELVFIQNRKKYVMESLPLGVINLTENYFQNDPPHQLEIRAMQENIAFLLSSQSSSFKTIQSKSKNHLKLIGTAGTITTLAAMDLKMSHYKPEKINGHVLTFQTLNILFQKMAQVPSIERVNFTGLEYGREMVILAGTLVILTLMNMLEVENLWISDAGLLEGILLDALEK